MKAPTADFTHVPVPLAQSRWPHSAVVLTAEEADVVRTALARALGALDVLGRDNDTAMTVQVGLEAALAVVTSAQHLDPNVVVSIVGGLS